MKKHNDETCEGCVSTENEDVCFVDWEEMMDYRRSQLPWYQRAWEFVYFPVYRFVVHSVWDKIRPGTIKHYYQRAKQGYSYQDNWSIDHYMVDTLIPMFKNLKKDSFGISMEFYDEKDGVDGDGNPTEEADVKAEERQQNVYSEIIYGLKCAKLIQEADYDYKKDGEYERLNKSVKRSFELIGDHFFTFWD